MSKVDRKTVNFYMFSHIFYVLGFIYVCPQFNVIPWNEPLLSMELHAIPWKDSVHPWNCTVNSMEEHYLFHGSNTVIPWNKYINSME